MADAFDQFELLVREYIAPSVTDLVMDTDDVAQDLIGTFQPETVGGRRGPYATSGSGTTGDANSGFSPAGYEARYEIRVQVGGRIAGGTFLGNTQSMMGANSHLVMGQAADAKYLDPRKTPARSYIELAMRLKRLRGSITINRQQYFADMATKPLEQVAGDHVMDAVQRLRSYISNCFYGDGSGYLAQVNSATPVDVLEAAGGVEIPIDGGTFARFMKGDIIVGCTSTGSPAYYLQNAANGLGAINGFMRVVNIDADNRSIWLQAEPGEGPIRLTDNAVLLYADTYLFGATTGHELQSLVPQGIGVAAASGLLRTSGIFPGSINARYGSNGLNVANHSELKAFIVDHSSTPVDPTPDEISAVIDKILDSNLQPPTAVIGERSLWTLYGMLEREAHGIIQIPMGAPFQAAGGVSGPIIRHMEHAFSRFVSNRIEPGSVLGLSPDTWMKYMPLGDRSIHWFYGNGPMSGIGSIFGPTFDGLQATELADAPFDAFCEFGCLNPRRNFRIRGLKTQRDV